MAYSSTKEIILPAGSLVTQVVFVKKGESRNFLMVDAGMNDLIRPALYGAFHKIENITAHYQDGDSRSASIYDQNLGANVELEPEEIKGGI